MFSKLTHYNYQTKGKYLDMSKNKLLGVIEGAIIVALGVLIAIFGFGAVDLYFAIASTVVGAALLGVSIYGMSKNSLDVGVLALSGVLIAIGVGLFTHYISFGILINLIVIAILGFGAALIIYGIYLIAKKYPVYGTLVLIIGVVLVTLSILYICLADFRNVFWIIVGIVIALYGVLYIVAVLTERKSITKK